MSMSDDPLNKLIGKRFKDALNKHGHAFQDALLHAIAGIRSQAGWTPWVPEFPIEVQGANTRIDFALIDKRFDMYLICECKRSIANWLISR